MSHRTSRHRSSTSSRGKQSNRKHSSQGSHANQSSQRKQNKRRSQNSHTSNSWGKHQSRSFANKHGKYINPDRYINKVVTETSEHQPEIGCNFTDFNLEPALQQSIASRGYQQPTPIQDQAIPLILQNKDVAGFAQTGTGKTAAFLIPLLNKVLLDHQQGVLIVVPTRELATQISDEFSQFAQRLPISKVLCVGGVSIRPQIEKLRHNPHFVIGTPGRLKDLVQRQNLDLSMFTNVVLDEVDRMLDIGFVKDIRFLIDKMPAQRQSLFFSATQTQAANKVMRQFSSNPEIVEIPARDTSSQVDQDIVRIKPGVNKVNVLADLLQQVEFERVIVFGRTKRGINKLEKILVQRGVSVCSIHGNKSQNARQRSLRQFEQGKARALLATDVASRGIDIDGVTHVINYDEPNTYEDYIHRIGRTGRAGNTGKALTFVG